MSPKCPSDATSARDSKGWWLCSALHSMYASIDPDLCGGYGSSFIPEQMERSSQSQLLSIKIWSSAEAEPALNNTWLVFPYTLPAGAHTRIWAQTCLLIFKRLTFISAAARIFWHGIKISGRECRKRTVSPVVVHVCPCASDSLWFGYFLGMTLTAMRMSYWQ